MLELNHRNVDFLNAIEAWFISYKADPTQNGQESLQPVFDVGTKLQEAQVAFRDSEDVLNDIIKRTTSD